MATNFKDKIGESTYIHFYSSPWHSGTVCNISIQILTSLSGIIWQNLVNFGPVTPEYTKVKYVHPVVSLRTTVAISHN